MTVFETLNNINVNDRTEKKGGLTYLSWAWAWAEVKKHYPKANYTVYERDNINYFTDGRTCWVKTGVTIEDIEHIEYLPVMDYKNKSIPLDKVTSFDVNKAIQRSLTKALARHGLGLYIYAGEDLPEDEQRAEEERGKQKISKEMIDDIEQRIVRTKSDRSKFMACFNVKNIAEMTVADGEQAIKMLKLKENGNAERNNR